MKKILYILFLFLIFLNLFTRVFAEDCDLKEGFELYECREKEICKIYLPEKIFYKTDSYEIETSKNGLNKAKNKYRNDMNSIYKCAIIETKINSLNFVKKRLIKKEPTGELNNKIGKKLDKLINGEKTEQKDADCRNTDRKSEFRKLELLQQTTYEICKFESYLEYLREYNSKIKNISKLNEDNLDEGEEEVLSLPISSVVKEIVEANNKIDLEIDRSYRIFSIAFNSYNEFENNFPLHVYLLLLRDDLIVFRDKLYQAIGPINQVVYKISNAMSY